MRVPPGTWRGYEAGPEGLEIIVIGAPNLPARFATFRTSCWAGCFGSVAVRALPLSDAPAMLGHAHVTTSMRCVHHRPGADDAARLSSAFRGDDTSPLTSPVPRAVPRDGQIGAN